MPSGYTDKLPTDTLLDTAVISIAGVMLSATRGGTTFNPGSEFRNIEYDGKKGNVAGLDRKIFMAPTLSTTLIQAGPEVLRVLEAAGSGTGNSVTIKPAGELFNASTEYITNLECTWRRANGGTVKVTFAKALCTSYELSGQDRSEAEISVTFEARQDPAALGTNGGAVPYSIAITAP